MESKVESFKYSEEVNQLVKGLEKDCTLNQDLSHAVGLELVLHLDAIQNEEQDELWTVNNVPYVLDVLHSLLLHLHGLKNYEENLGEQADDVEDVQKEHVARVQWKDIGHQESYNVESHDKLNKLLGSLELEIDDLSDSFKVIEVQVIVVFDPENTSQVIVVEVYVSVVVFLDVPDLLSNDDFGEVDRRVFYLHVFLFFILFFFSLVLFKFNAHHFSGFCLS